jgi:hypothetical protein
MGHDNREREFEQALARHLRAAASQKSDGAAEATCPDAATLAAFHERMLSNEEMNAAKVHIAGCARCQEILTMLETNDELVADGAEQESVLELGEAVLIPAAADRREYSPESPKAVIAGKTTQVLKAPREFSRGRRAVRKWLAPAGAIAAGLLIWMVEKEGTLHKSAPVSNIEMAQQRANPQERLNAEERSYADRITPAAPVPERGAESKRLDDALKSESKLKRPADGFAARRVPAESTNGIAGEVSGSASGGVIGGAGGGAKSDADSGKLRRESRQDALNEPVQGKEAQQKPSANIAGNIARQGDLPVVTAAPPAVANAEGLRDKKAGNSAKDAEGTPDENARASGKNILKKQKLEPGVAAASAPTVQPVAPHAQSNAPASEAAKTTATTSGDDEKKKQSNERAEVFTTAQAEVTSKYERSSSSLQNAKVADARTIVAPDGTALWRLRGAGKIERSTDRGRNWEAQNTPVTAELLAGSAPSDAVCWVVGRAGTILRTTDGGGHWSKLVSPVGGDIGGIRAVDALHATIFGTTGGKRVGFATNDGGVTWTPVKE